MTPELLQALKYIFFAAFSTRRTKFASKQNAKIWNLQQHQDLTHLEIRNLDSRPLRTLCALAEA